MSTFTWSFRWADAQHVCSLWTLRWNVQVEKCSLHEAAGLNRYTDIEGKGGWGRLETLPTSGSVAEPVNPPSPHTLTVNTHRFRKHAAWETNYIWTLWCVAVLCSSSLSADSQHPDLVKVLLASLRVTEYIHTYHHHHLIFVISKKKKY